MTAFEEMGIMPEIAKAVEELEWTLPTDIQAEAIPMILGGGDVLMAAETGSGKTGAFCLPVLQIVWETMHGPEKQAPIKDLSSDILLAARDRAEGCVIRSDGLSCQSKEPSWQGVRANKGVKKVKDGKPNKFYYEVYFTEPGLARVGWSLPNGTLDLGTDRNGWGYGGTAKKSNSRSFDNYGSTFGDRGDVIGNLLDLDAGEISWTKNGEHLGIAYRLTPQLCEQIFIPTICTKNAMVTLRFKPDAEGKHEPPSKFSFLGDLLNTPKIVPNPNIIQGVSAGQKGGVSGPKAIILEPSRELAEQTYQCIKSFKKYLEGDVRLLLILGGQNVKEQLDGLRSGVDIIVATPGRLEELINNGSINVKSCRFFIIDEIDGLLQQKQEKTIMRIHSLIPRMFDNGRRLQMIVCSATLHNFDVKKLAEKIMYFPTWIDLKGEDSVPDTVHHVVLRVDPREMTFWKTLNPHIKTDGVHLKDRLNLQQPTAETLSEAVKILKGELTVKAIDTLKMDQGIIFCRTKLDCDNLEAYLNLVGGGSRNPKRSYSCVCLHADKKPQERKANLEKFKAGECNFLICTDVAARGIDVKGVPFVIQVTLPDEKANYIHRIGRVGRAERMGLAVSLVASVPEKVWYHSNCNTRGHGCYNTKLTTEGGCCIWYNEMQLLAEIEESLGVTIQTITADFDIQTNEFDGKVVYGEKRKATTGINYQSHVEELSGVVSQLSKLEQQAQLLYLQTNFLQKVVK